MLQVDKLHQYYGGSHILRGLSFDVKVGEVTCLLGRNGVGKTTLAFTVAQEFTEEVYIFQCTSDTRPEDLLVTPVIDSGQTIRYHASALATAMIRGGVCILDEGNRMSEKSWA